MKIGRAWPGSGLLLAVLAMPGAAGAHDRWESGIINYDNDYTTPNEILHAIVQEGHDLEANNGVPDNDWVVFRGRARHSYEARVGSGTMSWTYPGCTSFCARFDRVDANGVVLTAGVPDGAAWTFEPTTLSVRWIASASGNEWLRVLGDTLFPASVTYDLVLYDTTYFAPRFNNSATQVTVLIVQNGTDDAITGSVYFYNAAGTLLHAEPLSLGPQGVMVLNTAALPGVGGQSGAVAIAHTGVYGGALREGGGAGARDGVHVRHAALARTAVTGSRER
jgi:hypothetical protein